MRLVYSRWHCKKSVLRLFSSTKESPVTIELNSDEEKLFDMFRDFVKEKRLTTTVRVAGGWVRDKIMNTIVKDDIDIAVDNMTGKEFVELLHDWSSKNGRSMSKIGVIQQNPEKSKSLLHFHRECKEKRNWILN
jgi:tRNA nucleotidyltransferase/poly(A) polymerase